MPDAVHRFSALGSASAPSLVVKTHKKRVANATPFSSLFVRPIEKSQSGEYTPASAGSSPARSVNSVTSGGQLNRILGARVKVDAAGRRGIGAAVSAFIPDGVSFSEIAQGVQFITDGSIVSILDVIRSLFSLPPFFEAVGGDADESRGADFIEHGIIVIG